MNRKTTRIFTLSVLGALAFAGVGITACSDDEGSSSRPGADGGPSRQDSGGGTESGRDGSTVDGGTVDSGLWRAAATLTTVGDGGATDGGTVGTATLAEPGSGAVAFTAQLQGVEPGIHGLHVHSGTSCADAGGHFGPDGGPYHGEWTVTVTDAGTATFSGSADVTVRAGQWSAVGHPLVLHGRINPDAGGGAAPPPVACGIFRAQ
jgi:Cu-Zn family superoxide dismutase